MYNKLLLFLICISCSIGFSQNTFKGIVIEDDTSMNVTNAIIAIEGTAIAQRTDLNGAFNFSEKIPTGKHVVTITKDGYVTKYVLIEVLDDKNIIMNNLKLEVTKKERKRREKAIKKQQKQERKEQKEKEKFLKKAQKEKEKQQKALEKQQKKLLKNKNSTDVIPVYVEASPAVVEVSDLQIKYGTKLNVTPESITNTKLYEFIESWEGTKYVLGGETEEGIDCSSFTQRLFISVYNIYLERTADKQFASKLTEKFGDQDFIQEGDLIFFHGFGENENIIVHVGVYLQNGYFVHATPYTRDTGFKGVKISNLTDSYWAKIYVGAGRRHDKPHKSNE